MQYMSDAIHEKHHLFLQTFGSDSELSDITKPEDKMNHFSSIQKIQRTAFSGKIICVR
jgi:hypothetical protein